MRGFSDSSKGNGVASRAGGARWVLVAVFAVLAFRLVYMQLVEHERYQELALGNILREEVLPGIRGVIRDRDGNVLVNSVPSFTVAIDPFDRAYLGRPQAIATTLAFLEPIIEVPADSMAARIRAEQRRSYRSVRLRRHLSVETVAYIEERRDQLPGVVIEVEPLRHHVYGALAAHVLGYVGEVSQSELERNRDAARYRAGDVVGRTGIERVLERDLRGLNGRQMVEVSAIGRHMVEASALERRADPRLRFTNYASVEPPTNGADVVLTLDLRVQQAVEEAFPADHAGAVVVIDLRDGGILAAMSRPAIDPNEFARGLSAGRWRELNTDSTHPQHNRAFMSGYPPGSVFKVASGFAALGPGGVGSRETFATCAGGWYFGDRWFGCHHEHGTVSFEMAMVLSCDTYFYQVGLKAGLDAISETALALGLGRETGIELPESAGLVPDEAWYNRRYGKRGWTRGNILNLSIGQGEILSTPLQLANLMATVARAGRPVTPHLVQRIGGRQTVPEPTPQRLDADTATMRSMERALEQVVGHVRGTGKASRVPGVRIAGKTGTAQNPHGEDHALFAGFAPVDAPRIAFAVVVENGGHGGEAAAPVAARLIEASLVDRHDLWADGTGVDVAVERVERGD